MCGGVILIDDAPATTLTERHAQQYISIDHNAPKKILRIMILLETIYFSSSLPGNEISKTNTLFLAMQRYYKVH